MNYDRVFVNHLAKNRLKGIKEEEKKDKNLPLFYIIIVFVLFLLTVKILVR